MPRRLLWSFIGLICLVAGLGLVLGLRAQGMTETRAIERVAARYVAETGARPSDCAARPAASAGLWLVVACAGHDYFVDRFGRVVDVSRPGAAS